MPLKLSSCKYVTEYKTDIYKGVGGEKKLRSEYSEEEILRYAIKNGWHIIVVTSFGEKGKNWELKGKGFDRDYLQAKIEDSLKSDNNKPNKPRSRLYFIDDFLMSL